jgi:probable HAF family extracellular repeat protein
VNDAGAVVGGSETASGTSEGFVYINGAMYSLNPNPLPSAIDSSIGNPVNIDLTTATETNGIGTASNPVNSPIGTLDSLAEAINNEDQAVGYELDSTGNKYAALWTIQPDGSSTLTDLNDFAPAGWDLIDATGINNNGQIIGVGTYGNGGAEEGFVLTLTAAVPEPTIPGLVAGLGLTYLLGRRTQKGRAISL